MVLYISRTHDFEPKISAKKCGLYTRFYGNAPQDSDRYTTCRAEYKKDARKMGSVATLCDVYKTVRLLSHGVQVQDSVCCVIRLC